MNPAIATTFQVNGVAVSLAGGTHQFVNQLIGVLFTVALGGRRHVHPAQNRGRAGRPARGPWKTKAPGLDLTQHGERAYNE